MTRLKNKPAHYRGSMSDEEFNQLIHLQKDNYRTQIQDKTIADLRKYFVEGVKSHQTSYGKNKQAFYSRLVYYIRKWENQGLLK